MTLQHTPQQRRCDDGQDQIGKGGTWTISTRREQHRNLPSIIKTRYWVNTWVKRYDPEDPEGSSADRSSTPKEPYPDWRRERINHFVNVFCLQIPFWWRTIISGNLSGQGNLFLLSPGRVVEKLGMSFFCYGLPVMGDLALKY